MALVSLTFGRGGQAAIRLMLTMTYRPDHPADRRDIEEEKVR